MKSIINKSAPRGKVVIATKSYLPGELVVQEKPLMVVPKEHIDKFEQFDVPYDVMCNWANYTWFQTNATAEDRAKVLALFEPAVCKEADRLRGMAEQIVLYEPNGDQRSLTHSEIDLLVKLAKIMKRNTFPMRGDQILYAEMSNFAHSCDGNCHFLIEQGQTEVRCSANRTIAAGEELTISYLPIHGMEFTHIRRRHYLDTFEFTCHCPRCDAPGDDTRKLCCPDLSCNGVMMVCQPINNDKIYLAGLSYTGVEYVEPHLLACTECHHAAPDAYQRGFAHLEDRLRHAAMVLSTTPDLTDPLSCEILHTEVVERARLMQAHSLCMPVHRMLMKLARNLYKHYAAHGVSGAQLEMHRARVQQAAAAYISAQELLFRGVPQVAVLGDVCRECIFFTKHLQGSKDMSPIYPPPEAKLLLQTTMRTHLMFLGRETGRKFGMCDELHEYLLKALEKLPVPQQVCDMQVCAFCEESPASASMKRSRCGACKKVMYCSAGCQKAHWKLHKKTCRNAPPQA